MVSISADSDPACCWQGWPIQWTPILVLLGSWSSQWLELYRTGQQRSVSFWPSLSPYPCGTGSPSVPTDSHHNLVNAWCSSHTHSLFSFLLPDNTAGILTRKNGYNRHEMSTYLLPVVISDNDYPVQSSTGTVTVRVCACDHHGNMQSCHAEALIHPTGLSTGALVAILLCILILLGKLLLPASSLPLVRGTHCYCDTLDFSASPIKAYSLI